MPDKLQLYRLLLECVICPLGSLELKADQCQQCCSNVYGSTSIINFNKIENVQIEPVDQNKKVSKASEPGKRNRVGSIEYDRQTSQEQKMNRYAYANFAKTSPLERRRRKYGSVLSNKRSTNSDRGYPGEAKSSLHGSSCSETSSSNNANCNASQCEKIENYFSINKDSQCNCKFNQITQESLLNFIQQVLIRFIFRSDVCLQ